MKTPVQEQILRGTMRVRYIDAEGNVQWRETWEIPVEDNGTDYIVEIDHKGQDGADHVHTRDYEG